MVKVATPRGGEAWNVSPLVESEIVLSACRYDLDLGMRDRGQITQQLRIDIPRCVVMMDKRHIRHSEPVYSKSPFPRMATQAVFAPVLEWFHDNRLLAQGARSPLHIDIDTRSDTMCITKSFHLFHYNTGEHVADTCVQIHSCRSNDMLVIWNHPLSLYTI